MSALFIDNEFPPNETSVGNIESIKTKELSFSSIKWQRVTEVCKGRLDSKVQLFHNGIRPEDIQQGGLGNCWMLSGFAAAAGAAPTIIEQRFVQPLDPNSGKPCISKDGRYIVQLFDDQTRKWINITIDDLIPVVRNQDGSYETLSAAPQGCEAWVLLLEKAFAKYMGSYAAMEGGWVAACLKSLVGDMETGFQSYECNEPGGTWKSCRYSIKPSGKKGPNGRTMRHACEGRAVNAESQSSLHMFHKLRSLLNDNEHTYIIGAGTYPGSDKDEQDGIFYGHDYSIVGVAFPEGFTMVKLANPHGAGGGEWTGPWCDGDRLWKEHPDVAKLCGYTGSVEDGMFWMQKESFEQMFSAIYVMRLPKADGHKSLNVSKSGKKVEEDEFDDEYEYEYDEDEDEDYDEDEDEDEEDEEDEEEDPDEVFDQFDADGNGFMNPFEMAAALRSLTGDKPDKDDVAMLLKAVGADAKKGASKAQFRKVHSLLPWYNKFIEWDEEGAGELEAADVVAALESVEEDDDAVGDMRNVGKKEMKQTVRKLFAKFDSDRSGALGLSEFLRMVLEMYDLSDE